jgi:type II secretory pathway pseudopilin PulG
MENPPPKPTGFAVVRRVIAIVIAGIVIVLAVAALVLPAISGPHHGSVLMAALRSGREIHQATSRMALDGAASEPPSVGWPGDLAAATTNPITTSGQFVEYLVDRKYLDRESLAKLFRGPGCPAYPGTGSFEGKYSPYFFFKVTEYDGDDAIFLATKNFHYGAPLDVKGPYGDKGCVIVRKGGDAHLLTGGQAQNKYIGVMPGGTDENRGEQEGNVLSD